MHPHSQVHVIATLQAMQKNNNVPVTSTYVYIASMQMQYCKHDITKLLTVMINITARVM